jgi:NAD(P)-dependent dehydrogenase (short-subunit alcohol dehydrogenase family)
MAVLPSMRARRKGTLAFVTSIGGKIGVPHLAPYSAAKFAEVGFAQALRAEVAKDGEGVRVVHGIRERSGPEHRRRSRRQARRARHRAGCPRDRLHTPRPGSRRACTTSRLRSSTSSSRSPGGGSPQPALRRTPWPATRHLTARLDRGSRLPYRSFRYF